MPFLRSEKYDSYHKIDFKERTITTQQKKKCQHELANFYKQAAKNSVSKGLDTISVSIVDNLIVLTISGYMTKFEQFATQNKPDRFELLRQVRLEANEQMLAANRSELESLIERNLGVNIVGHMYDLDAEDDYSLWIIILDTKITVTDSLACFP